MFALLKFFFLFIIVAFLVGLFIILAFVGNVMSMFRKVKKTNQFNETSNNTYRDTGSRVHPNSGQPQKKIIPKDEGEYVDFEEI